MKGGAENRKKTITLGILGAVAVCGVLYNLGSLFGGSDTPPAAVAPVNAPATTTNRSNTGSRTTATGSGSYGQNGGAPGGPGAIPGVAAQRLATASSGLDPTLDEAAMLRTENLVYSGSGRNIFSATYVPPTPIALPKNVPSARPTKPVYVPPVNTGPPPPPPIPLKFFGTAQRQGGIRKAFLLSGDDVYLAAPGDIVAKRYRVNQISNFGVQVTDLGSNNTQTLPLQQQ